MGIRIYKPVIGKFGLFPALWIIWRDRPILALETWPNGIRWNLKTRVNL